MHINSLLHIVALHFLTTQQHPLDYMVLLLFYRDPHSAYQDEGFSPYHYWACSLYNYLSALHLCTHYVGNYTKGPKSFEIFLSMFISTWIVAISHWRVNASYSKNWFPSHFLYKPDSCFMCTFLSCCTIFNKIIDFWWFSYLVI